MQPRRIAPNTAAQATFEHHPMLLPVRLRLAAVSIASGFLAVIAHAQLNYETPYFFTTLAGSLIGGSTDGTGSAARFSAPLGVTVDASGTLYVADVNNH